MLSSPDRLNMYPIGKGVDRPATDVNTSGPAVKTWPTHLITIWRITGRRDIYNLQRAINGVGFFHSIHPSPVCRRPNQQEPTKRETS